MVFVSFIRFKDKTGVSELYKCRDRSNNFLTHSFLERKKTVTEISLKDFSFSQLIVAVEKLFDTEGVPGFVKALVILIESLLLKSGVD